MEVLKLILVPVFIFAVLSSIMWTLSHNILSFALALLVTAVADFILSLLLGD